MPAYQDVRVLVLGASGFIGRRVARALRSQGADLVVAVRDSGSLAGEGFSDGQVRAVDLQHGAALAGLVTAVAPDIVFNLAGYGINPAERDPVLAAAINADLLPALVDAISRLPPTRWRGQRIVHTGSALEYGTCGGDLSETSVARPTTLYGRTKLAGTMNLQAASARHGVGSLTARLFTVYGPGERRGRLLPSLLEIARNGGTLDLTAGTQQRDFTYIEDVVDGLLRLGTASTARGEIVNLATGRLATVREFVSTAADVLGIPAEKLRFGALPVRGEEMSHQPVTTDTLQRILGWLPTTSIRQGIEKTLQQEFQGGIEIP